MVNIWSADEIARFSFSDQQAYVAPKTEMELELREIWAEILHLDAATIGKHHAFLEIGGDSVAAIRMTSLAQQRAISVAVTDVFDDSRLMSLALKAVKQDGQAFNPSEPMAV